MIQYGQEMGREIIRTAHRFTGNVQEDKVIAAEVLKESLPIHEKNANEEKRLWNIFVNSKDWWQKDKAQRPDINNKISVATAWAFSRTLNGYCFGEPIKYISRDTKKQGEVEKLSQMLDARGNHDATIMATMSASICGLGYKLALPSKESDLPFIINNTIIYPFTAFCVYTDEAISEKIMGVLAGKYTDKDGNEYDKYTVWTKDFQFIYVKGLNNGEDFTLIQQSYGETKLDGYPLMNKRIPLVEFERNAFRKGDWEVATDLLEMKNRLLSDRMDDIDQIIDYVLVLMNCGFESEEDKKAILSNRLIQLKVTDPQNKPSVEILQNPIDQSGVQMLVEYIDGCLQEVVGVPTRDERAGGGQDTGQAVKYRNGFRDLENNAGLIVPKTDKAEQEFVGVCIGYARNVADSGISELLPYDVRLKFMRTLSDDITASANTYSTLVNAGVDTTTALIASKLVSDPAETTKSIETARAQGQLFVQWNGQTATENEESEDNIQPDEETPAVEEGGKLNG